MAAASVNPKLYVHGCTGWKPAEAMAESNVETCVASDCPTASSAVMLASLKPIAVKSLAGNFANPWA
jgi:hypothetical protein